MGFIIAIVFGAIIGYVMTSIFNQKHSLIINIFIGIIGAIIGNLCFGIFSSELSTIAFNWIDLSGSILVSVSLLWMMHAMEKPRNYNDLHNH